jgi:hypothetical protein
MAWESAPGNDAGQMNGDGSRKLLLHDTEGSTIEGALGAYRKNNSWPTLTVDCRRRRVVRHLSDRVAARSLRNRSGGVETNRDGTVLIQIEIVGFANNRDGSMFAGREDYLWFGREVVGPLCRRNDIPLTSTVRWVAYPDSYGTGAPQRLSGAQWDAYSGILAHQHAPENDHGDTGLIDIATILTAARGDDFMAALNDAEQRELLRLTRQLAGVDPVEDSDIARGEVRASYKSLVQGAVLDGIRPRTDDHPDRGGLRDVFIELVREAVTTPPPEAPDAPASP